MQIVDLFQLIEKSELICEAKEDMASKLKSLADKYVVAAQKVYDDWDQDEYGYDGNYGHGGICDDIADAIGEIVSKNTKYSLSLLHDSMINHTSVAVSNPDTREAYEIDINPYNYEIGGGYTWRKIPNVKFNKSMVSIRPMDYDGFFDENGEAIDY